jgi:hypothetical protein
MQIGCCRRTTARPPALPPTELKNAELRMLDASIVALVREKLTQRISS